MNWFYRLFPFLKSKQKDSIILFVEQTFDITVLNANLYQLAFQHKSKNKSNNERLEFLGDSVLDVVVSELLYKHFPKKDEGELSKLRSKIVSRKYLNNIAQQLNLIQYLDYQYYPKHQKSNNIEGNTLEALIGALYIDLGFDTCKKIVENKLLQPFIDWKTIDTEITDYKSLIFNYSQRENLPINFSLLHENKDLGASRFHVALQINDELVAEGFGRTKKIAEQNAAQIFLEKNKLL